MRKKPITRDQVRVHHYEVWTLPYGSFHGRHHRDRAKALRPIERLWKPLLDQLHRQEREWWNSGPATKPELWGEFKSCVSVAYPSVPSTCRHCGRRFFHGYRRRSKWCSDLCAEQARAPRGAATIKARSQARAKARAGRTCETCGEPIGAQRSTKQYCSVGCRVAALRARA